MGHRPLLTVACAALLLSGCLAQFGELPDASGACDCQIDGFCRAARAIAPHDACSECRPERATDAWTDVCAAAIVETTFEDFADGTMPRSLGNLYVSADGAVRVVRTTDVNVDGFGDLVVSSQVNDARTYVLESSIYFGSESGLSPEARQPLVTVGAIASSIADLNADGWPDIVFSNNYDGANWRIGSFVYWGSRQGFSPTALTALPTIGATGNAVADLDRDGWLDIVFANQSERGVFTQSSYIYWGSAAGFTARPPTELPTVGATGVSIADLNADGHLDLVFSNHFDGTNRAIDSYVYWGSPAGYSAAVRTGLPSIGSGDNTIADIDADGDLDIVLSGHFDAGSYLQPTFVYLGDAVDGFAADRRLELPGVGGWATTVADLDGDGFLDLVLANYFDGTTNRTDSYVYRGVPGGLSREPVRLPTLGALSAVAVDFDRDGFLELAFTAYHDGTRYANDSLVFRGTQSGPSATSITPLPTIGAQIGTTADLGNVYDRSDREEYVSSVIELPRGAVPTRISWSAETPLGSSVRLSVRSAGDAAELAAAPWRGSTEDEPYFERPFAPLDVPDEHRYVQYRAVFRTPGFVSLPVLREVTIHHTE